MEDEERYKNTCTYATCVCNHAHTGIRGSHLSSTTCLTHAFFKSDETCSKPWCSLTLQTTHKTNEAVIDKWRQTSSATNKYSHSTHREATHEAHAGLDADHGADDAEEPPSSAAAVESCQCSSRYSAYALQ